MARVTVEDCILKVPNRFELCLLASQRAREIGSGAAMMVDRDNDKNPVVSLREIADTDISLDNLRDSLIKNHQKVILGRSEARQKPLRFPRQTTCAFVGHGDGDAAAPHGRRCDGSRISDQFPNVVFGCRARRVRGCGELPQPPRRLRCQQGLCPQRHAGKTPSDNGRLGELRNWRGRKERGADQQGPRPRPDQTGLTHAA